MNATKSVRLLPALVILVAMIAAPTLATVLRPTARIADEGPALDLEAMIPKQFGDWRAVDVGVAVVANPQQKEVLDRIYSQTLSRTYVSSTGYRVMLSIAYGGDQSDGLQVHQPDVCYPAQGFAVTHARREDLATAFGNIPVRRLLATMGQRHEPITYWITVGDMPVSGQMSRKFAQLVYGIAGKIPDGSLIRVSAIDENDASSFAIQDTFAREMLLAMAPEDRQRFIGSTAGLRKTQ